MEAPERFAHYPSFMLPTEGGAWVRWSDYATLAARLAEVEARAYTLAVAIMGGEDAPGYADSIPADQLADQLRDERSRRDEWTDACVKVAEARAERLEAALRDIAQSEPCSIGCGFPAYARAALQQEGGATDTPPPAPSPER
jgi:hypothetical protein